MIVTIDGPSGVGKSTVAHALSKMLSFDLLDTGALYRALAAALIEKEVDTYDESAVEKFIIENPLDIVENGSSISYSINGTDVTQKLRTPHVTKAASTIAQYAFVRTYLLPVQRSFALKRNIICEGRDMGTTVFPQADVKIFLYADASTRANRRYTQTKKQQPLAIVLKEINDRDQTDETRTHSPLKQADDAIFVDTSQKTFPEVVEAILQIIENIPPKGVVTRSAKDL